MDSRRIPRPSLGVIPGSRISGFLVRKWLPKITQEGRKQPSLTIDTRQSVRGAAVLPVRLPAVSS